MENLQLYLASRSPRRRALIEQFRVRYKTVDVDIDETPRQSEKPADYVSRLAIEKARKGWTLVANSLVPVVAADTCIVLNEQIIGKVETREASKLLLKRYSANSHQVYTGIAMVGNFPVENRLDGDVDTISLVDSPNYKESVRVNISKVYFRQLSDDECERYWFTGEPPGKAGGYAIQGIAAAFIKKIEGSYSGIMGLPLCELSELMAEFNIGRIWDNNN